jgi:hypothetical protein
MITHRSRFYRSSRRCAAVRSRKEKATSPGAVIHRTAVIVQLVNDETALCWTSEFTTATKNDGVQFKAKAP